jgi:hypothetical protein
MLRAYWPLALSVVWPSNLALGHRLFLLPYYLRFCTEGDEPKITAKQCFENALAKDKTCKQAWLCLKEAGGGHVSSNHLSVEYKPAACQAEYDKIVAEEDRKAHQDALMKDKLSKK